MNKTVKFFLIAAAAVMLSASALQASIRTIAEGDRITVRYNNVNYRTGSGGEFQLGMVSPNAIPNYFHTFCAETGENLGGSNQVYYVASVGLTALNQGGTLTSASAALYRDYYNGMVAANYGYQYVTGGTYAPASNAQGNALDFSLGGSGVTFDMQDASTRRNSGKAVQDALWRMLYGTSTSGAATAIYNWYTSNYDAAGGADGYFGVRIANLVFDNNRNQRSQDQFVMTIPEPGSLAIWGLIGLGCTVMASRRRRLA